MNPAASKGEDAADLELEFPAQPQYVRMARHTVAALARLRDADDELVEDIKLAVSEACTRAVATNAAAGHPEPVRLRADVQDRSLIVEVLDRGPGPERTLSGPPEEIDTGELPFDSALAVPLIRGLVDQVALTPREGGGTSVRMVVSLRPERS
jgi:serine/threonine-protein kinase RsbW